MTRPTLAPGLPGIQACLDRIEGHLGRIDGHLDRIERRHSGARVMAHEDEITRLLDEIAHAFKARIG